MQSPRLLALSIFAVLMVLVVPAHAGETATCQGVPASIVGTPGKDSESGTARPDVATMGRSRDYFWGHGGDDLVCGGSGNDHLVPGAGIDHVYAGPGQDVVVSDIRSVEDKFYGGTGADDLWGASGKEVMRGGAGGDTLRAGRGSDKLYGWSGNDLLKAALNDRAHDYLEGGPGHDVCHIRPGDTAIRCEHVIVERAAAG
jgi:hypothetical protein